MIGQSMTSINHYHHDIIGYISDIPFISLSIQRSRYIIVTLTKFKCIYELTIYISTYRFKLILPWRALIDIIDNVKTKIQDATQLIIYMLIKDLKLFEHFPRSKIF